MLQRRVFCQSARFASDMIVILAYHVSGHCGKSAVAEMEKQIKEAAKQFEFEKAAALRDRIRSLRKRTIAAVTWSAVACHRPGLPGSLLLPQPADSAEAS